MQVLFGSFFLFSIIYYQIYVLKFLLHQQIHDETSTKTRLKIESLHIAFGYWKCMFVDSLFEYMGPPNFVHYH